MNNHDLVEENRNSKLFDGVLVTIDTKQALAHNRSVTDGSNYSTPRTEVQNRETADSPDQIETSTFALDKDTHDVTKNNVLLISIISSLSGGCLTIVFFCFWNCYSFVRPDCKEASVCKKLMCCKKRNDKKCFSNVINGFCELISRSLSACSPKLQKFLSPCLQFFGQGNSQVISYRAALNKKFAEDKLNEIMTEIIKDGIHELVIEELKKLNEVKTSEGDDLMEIFLKRLWFVHPTLKWVELKGFMPFLEDKWKNILEKDGNRMESKKESTWDIVTDIVTDVAKLYIQSQYPSVLTDVAKSYIQSQYPSVLTGVAKLFPGLDKYINSK